VSSFQAFITQVIKLKKKIEYTDILNYEGYIWYMEAKLEVFPKRTFQNPPYNKRPINLTLL